MDQKINQMLQKQFSTWSAKAIWKTAKRVYELFATWGVQFLTVVTYIRSTYLANMDETEFYDEFLPEVQRIAKEEARFTGAHPWRGSTITKII